MILLDKHFPQLGHCSYERGGLDMRILVTGGAGYIGSHVCVELLQNGHEVIVLDSLANSQVEALNRVQELTGKFLTFHKGDVRDSLILNKIFRQYEIDCVIHLAALKSVTESIQHPMMYYDTNVAGTIQLLQIMEKYQIHQLIYSSSIGIYGDVLGELIQEDRNVCFPKNPYLATKFIGEQLIQEFLKEDPQLKAVVFEYGNPAGAHSSGRIGESSLQTRGSIFSNMCESAWGQKPFFIYGDQYDTRDKTAVRDYIHVCDIARAHQSALKKMNLIHGTNRYILSSGIPVSVKDVLTQFQTSNQLILDVHVSDKRQGDISECAGNSSKARKELDWKVEHTLDDMCKDAWRFKKENPKGYR